MNWKLSNSISFCFFFFHSEATTYIAEIINAMGQGSANSQGLNHAVTTSERLRNSEQVIYLMTEDNEKK